MTTGAKAQDVTWTYADVYSDIKTQLDANQAFTKDGISVEWKFNTGETTKSYTITSTSFEISGGHGYFEFTAPEGKKFAKIVLNGSGSQSFCSWNPGYITGMTSTTWEGDEPAAVVNTGDGGWDFILYNPSTFEFYFAEEGTPLTPDADRKVWTLDKMPAGNVELKVTYFPGMLTLASGGNGTLAVDGLTEAFTQLDVPATWDGDNTVLTAAHLPGFKEMSDDAAQKWEGAPKEGLASLIYGFEGTKAKTADYVGGIFALSGTQDLTLSTVKTASADAKIYYSSEAQMPEGFDTDGTNIYVADGTAFKVNVTPAEGYKLASLMFGSEDITAQVKDGTAAVTMPTGNADLTLTATFTDQFELAFDDKTYDTNANITVTVGDGTTQTAATLTDGKLSVKAGKTVILNAKQGYKFKSVEAKKGISTLKRVKIGNYTIYYAEGENWYQAFWRDENNNCGLETSVGRVFTYDNKSLRDSGGDVYADAVIDPNKGYYIE
jgi:hypothetical protein